MISVQFLPLARKELKATGAFYNLQRPNLGNRFADEANRIYGMIAINPQFGHPIDQGYRRANLKTFPYYFAYIVRKEKVLIAAVAHSSRRPNYWIDRIR